jgi:hypothetical protein
MLISLINDILTLPRAQNETIRMSSDVQLMPEIFIEDGNLKCATISYVQVLHTAILEFHTIANK